MPESLHVSAAVCGSGGWPQTPASDWCCLGAVLKGHEHCTCWTPVYDLEQAEPQRDADTPMQAAMCGDCAYRPGSPERTGDPQAEGDRELLDDLVYRGVPFYCHAGIRRPVRWVHPPSGMEIPGHPHDYQPPKIDGRPYRADGQPALLCAGWSARRLHHLWTGAKQGHSREVDSTGTQK